MTVFRRSTRHFDDYQSIYLSINAIDTGLDAKEECIGKSSESVQCAMLKACDACADMGQL